MQLNRNVLTIVTTVIVAFAAGHLVQNADSYFQGRSAGSDETIIASSQDAQRRVSVVAPTNRFIDQVQSLSASSASRVPPARASRVSDHEIPPLPSDAGAAPAFPTDTGALARRMARLQGDFTTPAIGGPRLNQYGLPCKTSMTATPAPAAMADLTITASCHTDERVVISHDRLHFTARIPNKGELHVQVPAMTDPAVFVAELPGGKILTATASVPEQANFERLALQWTGPAGIQLHAYEFGAGFDDPGHVWVQAPRTPSAAMTGRGGFLTRLGSADLRGTQMAEIYSFPRGQTRDDGVVRMNVEIPITEANCGHEISAETLQPGLDGRLQSVELNLTVPDCKAKGEYLVLKNVIRDLKIAAN